MNLRDRSLEKVIVNNRNIITMTVQDFRNLPHVTDVKKESFDSIVILPAHIEEELHDSGYTCMDFVAVKKGKALYRLSGCSDILHIDGISAILLKKNNGWSIDCLPVSKLLHLRCNKPLVGNGYSSFEIFTESDYNEKKKRVRK